MIDALMMAYTVEMISIEKVVASVKRFSTFSASKELPFDLEDAMVFWINKVPTHKRNVRNQQHIDMKAAYSFLQPFEGFTWKVVMLISLREECVSEAQRKAVC